MSLSTKKAPVPVWQRWQPGKGGKSTGYWSHNHIEDGHSLADKPADKFDRGWAQGTWRKQLAVLGPHGMYGAPAVQSIKEATLGGFSVGYTGHAP